MRASRRLYSETDPVHGICGAHGGYETAECVMFGEVVGGAGCGGGQEGESMGCLLDDLRALVINNADQ